MDSNMPNIEGSFITVDPVQTDFTWIGALIESPQDWQRLNTKAQTPDLEDRITEATTTADDENQPIEVRGNGINYRSQAVRTVQLQSPTADDCVAAVAASDEARRWLDQGHPVYLVTGFQTAKNPRQSTKAVFRAAPMSGAEMAALVDAMAPPLRVALTEPAAPEDLVEPATQEDFMEPATQEDLMEPATQEDSMEPASEQILEETGTLRGEYIISLQLTQVKRDKKNLGLFGKDELECEPVDPNTVNNLTVYYF